MSTATTYPVRSRGGVSTGERERVCEGAWSGVGGRRGGLYYLWLVFKRGLEECDGMCRDKLKGSGRIGLKRGRERIRVQASVFSLLLVVVHGLAALRPT